MALPKARAGGALRTVPDLARRDSVPRFAPGLMPPYPVCLGPRSCACVNAEQTQIRRTTPYTDAKAIQETHRKHISSIFRRTNETIQKYKNHTVKTYKQRHIYIMKV